MSFLDDLYQKLIHEKKTNPLIDSIVAVKENVDEKIASPHVSASQIFPAIAEMIKTAQSEVLISLYKFQDESYGGGVIVRALEDLKKTADQERRNISVKFIVNQKKGPASFVSGGGKGTTIDYQKLKQLNSQYFNMEIAQYQHTSFDSSHEKYVITDGKKAAILTGDPTNKNVENKEETWIELGTLTTSESIAKQLRGHFSTLWNDKKVVTSAPSLKTNLAASFEDPTPSSQTNTNILLLTKAQSNQLAAPYYAPYKMALIEMLQKAQTTVDIMVNNINDKDIINAIAVCANRGVTINFVLGRYHGDSAEKLPFAGGTNRSSIQYLISLVKEECQINLNLKWACNKKGNLVQNMEHGTIHAKCVIVDGQYVLTGSSLMDQQSQRSRETDILFDSKTRAAEYQKQAFDPVFARGRPINKKAEVTRYQIKQDLQNANDIQGLKNILKNYILLREYESGYTGVRKLLGSDFYGRSKKVHAAQMLLEAIGTNTKIDTQQMPIALQEGLLGTIYQKYNALCAPQITQQYREGISNEKGKNKGIAPVPPTNHQ